MALEERAKAILIAHDCPPGHRAIAAMVQMAAEERERAAKVAEDAPLMFYRDADHMRQSIAADIRKANDRAARAAVAGDPRSQWWQNC